MLFGLIPTVLVINFFPLNLEKHVVYRTYKSLNRKYWFDDLESDGRKEKFAVGYNPDSTLFLFVFDERNHFLGQINFEHKRFVARETEPAFSLDVNQDGIKELILFTREKDSLFLNVFDYRQMSILRESRLVTLLGGYNNKQDFDLDHLGTFDVNGDAVQEVYFKIVGGFSKSPRQLYRYDYINDSLVTSINTGAAFKRGEGLESNGKFHMLLSASANGNFKSGSPVPYSDTAAWIFGFDQDLQMTFAPVYLGPYPFDIHSIIYAEGFGYCIAKSDSLDFRQLLRIGLDGSIQRGSYLHGQGAARINEVDLADFPIYYVTELANNKTLLLDFKRMELRPDRSVRHFNRIIPMVNEDLDGDGKNELVSINSSDLKAELFTHGTLRHGKVIELESAASSMVSANFYPELDKGEICFTSLSGSELFEYTKNPRFSIRYLVWIGIYMLSVGFVMSVLYLQRRRIEHRHALERQVADLQLQNLRNQLDPHFTFNALNSVGNAIYQENKEKAYDLFQRFTRMIRSSLMTSQQVFQSLQEEINFTTDYLEFQKTRFRDLFDYIIKVDPEVDLEKTDIPRMLIQGFAENAVKHAFHGIDYKGEIIISVQQSPVGIKITIKDNGIGIKRSKDLGTTSGTQQGQQLIQEQIRQIKRLYDRNIQIKITDKPVSGQVSRGTKAEILLK